MQDVFVAVLVAWAVFVIATRYAPQALRQWIRSMLARILGRLGWEIPLLASDPARASGSCGGCNGCANKAPGAAAGAQSITVDVLRRTARQQAR